MTLQEVLLDDGRPFCSHYGAVVGLTELGPEVQKKKKIPSTDTIPTMNRNTKYAMNSLASSKKSDFFFAFQ